MRVTDTDKIKVSDELIVAGYGLSWAWVMKSGAGVLRSTTLKVKDPKYSRTVQWIQHIHGSMLILLGSKKATALLIDDYYKQEFELHP